MSLEASRGVAARYNKYIDKEICNYNVVNIFSIEKMKVQMYIQGVINRSNKQ